MPRCGRSIHADCDPDPYSPRSGFGTVCHGFSRFLVERRAAAGRRNPKGSSMIRRALLTAALLLTSSGFARAATLLTPPFPGEELSAGVGTCSVFNDGKTAQVEIAILDRHGAPAGLNSYLAVEVGGGVTVSLPDVDLSTFSPSRCRFVVPGKTKIRAAFIWRSGNQPPVIIPAQ